MYSPNEKRYESMVYRNCGKSGLKLPAISLGLWHNFGQNATEENARDMLYTAFNLGITHFDIANNYGPPPGSAEEMFGKVMKTDFAPYRDEMVISSKAGYTMWPGPYGSWGSRKHMIASCDASLKRTGLDYFDIFYHHRPDPNTPIEETMAALDHLVRSGKALYVGVSNYNVPEQAEDAYNALKQLGTPCRINQPRYSMLNRDKEEGLFSTCEAHGVGIMAYAPLSGGRLTDKYLNGIPTDSRAGSSNTSLNPEHITPKLIAALKKLDTVAKERGQNLTQLAISWVLRQESVTSALIGASRASQIVDCCKAADATNFSADELAKIDEILLDVN